MKTNLIAPAIALGVASFVFSTNVLADNWSQETNRWVVQPTKTWVVDPVTGLTKTSMEATNNFVNGAFNSTTGWAGTHKTMTKTSHPMHHRHHHHHHYHHHQ